MLDIGWTEIAIIVIIAILVIGPKDLPKTMRTVAQLIAKFKGMMREFQSNLDDMIKETELEEVKKQVQAIRSKDFNQVIENTIDKNGELSKSMNFDKEVGDFNASMKLAEEKLDKPSSNDDPKSKENNPENKV